MIEEKIKYALCFYIGYIGINIIMIIELQRFFNPIIYMFSTCMTGGVITLIYYHIMDELEKINDKKGIKKLLR